MKKVISALILVGAFSFVVGENLTHFSFVRNPDSELQFVNYFGDWEHKLYPMCENRMAYSPFVELAIRRLICIGGTLYMELQNKDGSLTTIPYLKSGKDGSPKMVTCDCKGEK